MRKYSYDVSVLLVAWILIQLLTGLGAATWLQQLGASLVQ